MNNGLCKCGCGQPSPIAKQTRKDLGHIKGQPTPYRHGHSGHRGTSERHARLKALEREAEPGPNPSGLCMCGCGARTALASRTTRSKGNVKGKPVRYLVGHSSRKRGAHYVVDQDTGCWEWQLYRDEKGYGITSLGRKIRRAHIVMYERIHGPVPEGLELDHVCGNRGCCNPDHLEAVTHAENVRRSHGIGTVTP